MSLEKGISVSIKQSKYKRSDLSHLSLCFSDKTRKIENEKEMNIPVNLCPERLSLICNYYF